MPAAAMCSCCFHSTTANAPIVRAAAIATLQKVSNELGITALPYEKKLTVYPHGINSFPLDPGKQ